MKVAVVFLAVLASAVAADSEVRCQDGWEAGLNTCYKVFDFRVQWVEAWTYCTAMRSSLVEIEDQEEQDILADILGTKYSGFFQQYWIGLTDLITEGDWQWMRFKQSATYVNWIPGQPNNNWGKGEHCAHINAKEARNFQWNDHSCNVDLNFICESTPLA